MSDNVIVTDEVTKVIITDSGATVVSVGVPGPPGSSAGGVPPAGTTNQILAKNSNTDYDTHWIPQSFEQDFSGLASVTVTHNLGRRPAVTVLDTAGDECFGDVDHLSNNSLMVTFSSSFSGKIICN